MFGDNRLVLSAAEGADRLRAARSTAYRYLQSLTDNGFLEERDGSGFRLGPRVVDLARLARKGVGLSDLARPVMRALVKRTGMPTLLTRRAGHTVMCLESEDAGTSLRLSCERGEVLAINAGASALALLARVPAEELDELLTGPLPRYTDATHADPAGGCVPTLPRCGSRDTRWAMAKPDPDVPGIGAPVKGENSNVVGALSVVCQAAEGLSGQVARTEIG
jgi:DNA-binding IclR family transcriptional regulator